MSWAQRKKMMMMAAVSPAPGGDPYGVGATVITEYIRNGTGFQQGYRINATTGEYEQYGSNYASDVYIPVKKAYTMVKSNRINALAYYAADYSFISCVTSYNKVDEVTLDIPDNAAWMRVGTPGTGVNVCEITRTA